MKLGRVLHFKMNGGGILLLTYHNDYMGKKSVCCLPKYQSNYLNSKLKNGRVY